MSVFGHNLGALELLQDLGRNITALCGPEDTEATLPCALLRTLECDNPKNAHPKKV